MNLPFSHPLRAAEPLSLPPRVSIQAEDFDLSAELSALRRLPNGQWNTGVGAVASFVGTVRDLNDGDAVSSLILEHYPGMTERSIEAILDEAEGRWPLLGTRVVHRIGPLLPADQIVLVAVSSAHREASLAACAFIMDYLKSKAPFWKREATQQGDRWVDARVSDAAASARWAAEDPLKKG